MIYIQEYLLSLDQFQNPKVLKDKDAIYILLIRILLLEKGTIQSHPDMGIGIISRYRYIEVEKLPELKNDILYQIATYLPQLQGINVEVSYSDDQELIIDIYVDNVLYKFKTDTNTNTLNLVDI